MYDFTCCDIEPAILGNVSRFDEANLARNVLLLTLLLENDGNPSPPNYWSIFYDLYINKDTSTIVVKHSTKLVQYSQNMETWTACPYGYIIRMINVETLNLLNEYWSMYSTYSDPDRKHYDSFKADCKITIARVEPLLKTPSLTKSFGARFREGMPIAAHYMSLFWKTGTVDAIGDARSLRCNPLFVYSSLAANKFAIHWQSNPLSGFHLATSITNLTPESAFHHWNDDGQLNGKPALESALFTAKIQFNTWCTAFQNLARKVKDAKNKDGGLQIRFFAGDAIAFCLALGQATNSLNSYSRPYTVHALRLDGDLPTHHGAPLSFNVIDTSTLTEHVGSMNILTSAIPLLEDSATSVLYLETLRPDFGDDTTKLLHDVLCTDDIRSMCTLLGLVPAPYITAVSSRSKTQSGLINQDPKVPALHRIPWKFLTTNSAQSSATTACTPDSIAKLLYDIYLKMFSHESITYFQQIVQQSSRRDSIRFPPPLYTRQSYAALVAFLKPRISIDWTEFMTCLLRNIEGDPQLMLGQNSIQELFLQLHLSGAFTRFPFGSNVDGLNIPGYPPLSAYRPNRGVLRLQNPPRVTCLTITIPRRKLHVIYKSSVDEGIRVSMMFQVNILAKMFHNTFSSIHPVFGKLSPSEDGQTCVITEDSKGWHGSADLNLFVYIPTYMFFITDPREVEVSVRLQSGGSTQMAFRNRLGIELEVFKSQLLDNAHVQLLKSFPGLEAPTPSTVVAFGKKFATANDKMEITFPQLSPQHHTFTTRNTFHGQEERELLKSGVGVEFNVCTPPLDIKITFGAVEYKLNFPYPIAKDSIRLRIARKSGWIEIIASIVAPPLLDPPSQDPFPLIRQHEEISTWNLGYINFRRLSEISVPIAPTGPKIWLTDHLYDMYSVINTSSTSNPHTPQPLGDVKRYIQNMLVYVGGYVPVLQRVWTFDGDNETFPKELAVFVTGLFLDNNSHSVVAEAYVLPLMNVPHTDTVNKLITSANNIRVPTESYTLFKKVLRAMAERCRDWEHSESCEFLTEEGFSAKEGRSPFCSCGVGKVQKSFHTGEWKEISDYVTRVAITPIFSVPYIERTRFAGSEIKSNLIFSDESMRKLNIGPKCQVCGKEGRKKCGGCGEVQYCSRECQTKDWKSHKSVCRKAGS